MNQIETAVARAEGTMEPLEAHSSYAPVLTPVLVAATAGLIVGAAVGCAEGHCHLSDTALNYTGEHEISVGELLQARTEAL